MDLVRHDAEVQGIASFRIDGLGRMARSTQPCIPPAAAVEGERIMTVVACGRGHHGPGDLGLAAGRDKGIDVVPDKGPIVACSVDPTEVVSVGSTPLLRVLVNA